MGALSMDTLTVDAIRSELQVAAGLVLLSLPVLVSSLRYSYSCLAAVWFCITRLLLIKDTTLGSHLRMALVQVTSMSCGVLLGAGLVSVSKVITRGYGPAETALLVVLSFLGLIPWAVIRASNTDVVYFFGLLAAVQYGTAITLTHPSASPTEVWTDVALGMLISAVLASLAVIVVGALVMPTTAGGQVVHGTGDLLGDLSHALDKVVQHLCVPKELETAPQMYKVLGAQPPSGTWPQPDSPRDTHRHKHTPNRNSSSSSDEGDNDSDHHHHRHHRWRHKHHDHRHTHQRWLPNLTSIVRSEPLGSLIVTSGTARGTGAGVSRPDGRGAGQPGLRTGYPGAQSPPGAGRGASGGTGSVANAGVNNSNLQRLPSTPAKPTGPAARSPSTATATHVAAAVHSPPPRPGIRSHSIPHPAPSAFAAFADQPLPGAARARSARHPHRHTWEDVGFLSHTTPRPEEAKHPLDLVMTPSTGGATLEPVTWAMQTQAGTQQGGDVKLTIVPPLAHNATEYLQHVEQKTQPPPRARLAGFKLVQEPAGAHLLPKGDALQLRRDRDALSKLLVPAGLEPPWAHALMALWSRVKRTGWGDTIPSTEAPSPPDKQPATDQQPPQDAHTAPAAPGHPLDGTLELLGHLMGDQQLQRPRVMGGQQVQGSWNTMSTISSSNALTHESSSMALAGPPAPTHTQGSGVTGLGSSMLSMAGRGDEEQQGQAGKAEAQGHARFSVNAWKDVLTALAAVLDDLAALEAVSRDQGAEPPGEEDHSDVTAVPAVTRHTTPPPPKPSLDSTPTHAPTHPHKPAAPSTHGPTDALDSHHNDHHHHHTKSRSEWPPLSSFFLHYHPSSAAARRAAEVLLLGRPSTHSALESQSSGGPKSTLRGQGSTGAASLGERPSLNVASPPKTPAARGSRTPKTPGTIKGLRNPVIPGALLRTSKTARQSGDELLEAELEQEQEEAQQKAAEAAARVVKPAGPETRLWAMLQTQAAEAAAGAWKLWLVPAGPPALRPHQERPMQLDPLHATVRAALTDAMQQVRVLHVAVRHWPHAEARQRVAQLLTPPSHSYHSGLGYQHSRLRDMAWCPRLPQHTMAQHIRILSLALAKRARSYWAGTVRRALEAQADEAMLMLGYEVRAQHFVGMATHQMCTQVETLTKKVLVAFDSGVPPPQPQPQPKTADTAMRGQPPATAGTSSSFTDTPAGNRDATAAAAATQAATTGEAVGKGRPDGSSAPTAGVPKDGAAGNSKAAKADTPPDPAYAWLVELRKLAVSTQTWDYLKTCAQDGWKAVRDPKARAEVLANRRAQYGFKYWLCLAILLFVILLLQRLTPDSVVVSRPNMAYATAASVMRVQVETSVAYGVMRTVGTCMGCMLGYGVMYSINVTQHPILIGLLVVISITLLHGFQRTQLRIVTYITATSLVTVTWCQWQGCCDTTGTLDFAIIRMVGAIIRMVSIIVGSLFPMIVNQLVLPWFLNNWALEKLADSFITAADLLQYQYDALVKQLGGVPVTPTTAAPAGVAQPATAQPAAGQPAAAGVSQQPDALAAAAVAPSTPAVLQLSMPGTATAAAAVTVQRLPAAPGPPSSGPLPQPSGPPSQSSVTLSPAKQPSMSRAGSGTVRLLMVPAPSALTPPPTRMSRGGGTTPSSPLAGTTDMPALAIPSSAAGTKTLDASRHGGDTQVARHQTLEGRSMPPSGQTPLTATNKEHSTSTTMPPTTSAAVVPAAGASKAEPPPAKPKAPPTLATLQAPLTEVVAALARDATPWNRGPWATPHAVHAMLASMTILADRLAAFQICLQGTTALSTTFSSWVREHILFWLYPEHKRTQWCVVDLTAITKDLLLSKPRSVERARFVGELQDELVHTLACRWHARCYHVLLRHALHLKVVRAVRRQLLMLPRPMPTAAGAPEPSAVSIAVGQLQRGQVPYPGVAGMPMAPLAKPSLGHYTASMPAISPTHAQQGNAQFSPTDAQDQSGLLLPPMPMVVDAAQSPGAPGLGRPSMTHRGSAMNLGAVGTLSQFGATIPSTSSLAKLLAALEEDGETYPADGTAWQSCLFALTHVLDAAVLVARTALDVVGCTDATREPSMNLDGGSPRSSAPGAAAAGLGGAGLGGAGLGTVVPAAMQGP